MSTEIGRRAEQVAADYLRSKGYKMVVQNWRTRWCEIDLIVKKANTIYFVEVKYRGSSAQGFGLEYITGKKLEQMHFAAELWLGNNPKAASDYRLAALEVAGPDYCVTAWLDDVA
jgi:uncharacterized protein (TIGR00252 family)